MKYQPYLFKELDYLLSQHDFTLLYHKYKTSAKYRKMPFKLTKKQFKKLTSGRCFYCGISPARLFNRVDHEGRPRSRESYLYNGVDRINSKKGYIISNCVSCCFTCNRMKNTLDSDIFIKKSKEIYRYQKSKTSRKG